MCVPLTGARKVRMGFDPGDHVFGKNSVIMSLRDFILPDGADGADHLEDVIAIRMGKSLIVNTKSGQALTLFMRKVMAVEDETLHRSSKLLGFCYCKVIDQVGVQPAGFG
jgi:hypothetical protein